MRIWLALVAFSVLLGTTLVAQTSPGEVIREMMREGTLKVGDPAPDFDLKERDGVARVRLSSFKDQKPVALVFGSYT